MQSSVQRSIHFQLKKVLLTVILDFSAEIFNPVLRKAFDGWHVNLFIQKPCDNNLKIGALRILLQNTTVIQSEHTEQYSKVTISSAI